MYVSLKWIEQMFNLQNLSLNLFLERLTLAGFEIESIETKKSQTNYGDLIIDISFTTNRADISNIKGFGFELSSFFTEQVISYKPFKIQLLSLSTSQQKKNFLWFSLKKNEKYKLRPQNISLTSVSLFRNLLLNYLIWEKFFQIKYKFLNSNSENYSTNDYLLLFQKKSNEITMSESPKWIQKRLSLMNFKSVNNVIDTLNYIMVETGQVFFAYDINALKNFTKSSNLNFIQTVTSQKEKFSLSKFEIINLPTNVLTLTIENKVVSIFGHIQDFNTVVTRKTSQILLQVSLYNSKQIKQISKTLGFRTEYSLKLEKQTDLNLLEQAYFRLLYLLKVQGITFQNSSIKPSKSFNFKLNDLIFYYFQQSFFRIKVFYKNINRLIGPYKKTIKEQNFTFLKSLRILNFKVYVRTDSYFTLAVPLQRQLDIEKEVDIIEEIVRILGFNNFKPLLPTENPLGKLTKLEKFKRRLKSSFISLGLTESLHSIFTKKIFLSETLLQNPLFNESAALRVSLLKTLIEKSIFNQKSTRENFETFEFGRVLNKNCRTKKELEFISGIFGGNFFRSSWGNSANSPLNWFEAKGLIENLFSNLDISIKWTLTKSEFINFFHPNRTANLFIGSQIIGIFGQIHPNLAFKEGLTKDLYLFEFNLEILTEYWKSKTSIHYNFYTPYPISYVDLTCILQKTFSFQKIKETIFSLGQPLLTSIELFDYYSKPPIKEGYCSLSFKLGFSSMTRTLVSSEVNHVIESIVAYLHETFDIEFN
uniref:phenylalanyl tRNA synthetase beta subunit n=1 Tax=Dictyotopsis propagulifera TaxID=670095 RepID=UPI002E7A3516|nr:phenylalanyl tRNA synthetase beta subunit [Dictyotopsis propagulifera]WAM63253.1 phenylalanyl tRNA synthetase beta subunit [Dictyotopsis propagulifera]